MMEEKKIFVNIANSEILEVSDMAMENTESITVGSLDEAIDSFNEKNWEFDDNIRAKLEEIFSEDEGDVLEALETAIHHALSNYQLDIDIKAPNGKIIHPREWFTADLETINDVVNGIIAKLRMS